jgi:hypothetical protein
VIPRPVAVRSGSKQLICSHALILCLDTGLDKWHLC